MYVNTKMSGYVFMYTVETVFPRLCIVRPLPVRPYFGHIFQYFCIFKSQIPLPFMVRFTLHDTWTDKETDKNGLDRIM